MSDGLSYFFLNLVRSHQAEPCLCSVLTFLNDWLVNQLIDWLVDLFSDILINWLVGLLGDWLIHWILRSLIFWLIDCCRNGRDLQRSMLGFWRIPWKRKHLSSPGRTVRFNKTNQFIWDSFGCRALFPTISGLHDFSGRNALVIYSDTTTEKFQKKKDEYIIRFWSYKGFKGPILC